MKYVPLVVADGVFLAIVAHSWFVKGEAPSNVLLTVIVGLVLAPLAARIKILEVIDFRKTVDRIDEELTEAKGQISTVVQQIEHLHVDIDSAVNTRQDQTANLHLNDLMASASIKEKAEERTNEVLQSADDVDQFALSPAFRTRLYVLDEINGAIEQIVAVLKVDYIYIDTYFHGVKEPHASDAMTLGIPELIMYFRGHGGIRPNLTKKEGPDHEQLDYLRRL